MMSHHESSRYNVYTTQQFEELWSHAVDLGVIDAAVDESQLDGLISFLSVDPCHFRPVDTVGEFVDVRRIGFMPSANPTVEVWYSVVEDDKAVILISVELIYPAQPGLPGFDF